MKTDRFDYGANLQRASAYSGYRSALWPPSNRYALYSLNIADNLSGMVPSAVDALEALRVAVEKEWQHAKTEGGNKDRKFSNAEQVAGYMRDFARSLSRDDDKRAIELRARALVNGYCDADLVALKQIQEDIALVVGRISTWYGKQIGGLPTAFACRNVPDKQHYVNDAMALTEDIAQYLRTLHTDLRLGELPAFAATEVIFMSGEGNLHPKHIAYFLPEDEGVKRSPFKKTYYFSNTHSIFVRDLSLSLAQKYLNIGVQFNPAEGASSFIPTLGVLAHEMGHFVHRPSTQFASLNAKHRWASVTLQEIAADVFGTLIVSEVLAEKLGLIRDQVIAYYLSESLRYIDRGLGLFPDSDGMYLQIAYLVQVGAMSVQVTPDGRPVLAGEVESIVAGLRSMARVIADALLANDPDFAEEIYFTYGPENSGPLKSLVDAMSGSPLSSIEYIQDH